MTFNGLDEYRDRRVYRRIEKFYLNHVLRSTKEVLENSQTMYLNFNLSDDVLVVHF